MKRGTTAQVVIDIDNGIDLRGLKTIWIALYQPGKLIKKEKDSSGVTVNENNIVIDLTQEETLKFRPGVVLVEVRGLTTSGTAFATDTSYFDIGDIILDGVIT